MTITLTTTTLALMECWLSGAFALESDAALGRAITVQLSLSRPTLSSRTAKVSGSLSADTLAADASVAGTVSLRGRTVHYGLRFEDDAGRPVELRGSQELALRRPPRGFSVVAGELVRDEHTIGRVRLRLDPRNGMKGLFSWA